MFVPEILLFTIFADDDADRNLHWPLIHTRSCNIHEFAVLTLRQNMKKFPKASWWISIVFFAFFVMMLQKSCKNKKMMSDFLKANWAFSLLEWKYKISSSLTPHQGESQDLFKIFVTEIQNPLKFLNISYKNLEGDKEGEGDELFSSIAGWRRETYPSIFFPFPPS